MAETATKTAAPRRTRATATKAAAPAKVATPAAAPAEEETTNLVRTAPFDLEYVGDTKSFAVFTPAKNTGCVGKFYAPLGTVQVRVVMYGPPEAVQG